MPVSDAREMLMRATRDGYAVGAFNVTSILQLEAVLEAAVEKRSPVMIQTSVSPAKFLDPAVWVAVYRTLAARAPVPVALHLDHCTDPAFCLQCARSGFTSIMIDASQESFESNVARTREIVDACHALGGISVEGELGTVSGVEDQLKVVENEALLCDPVQAVSYVDRTGVDAFAPAIGTAHGVYATKDPKIDIARFEAIAGRLNSPSPRVPLVVHGGTGLPDATVKRLIASGGRGVRQPGLVVAGQVLKPFLVDAEIVIRDVEAVAFRRGGLVEQ